MISNNLIFIFIIIKVLGRMGVVIPGEVVV
jgi:hypothetical protein